MFKAHSRYSIIAHSSQDEAQTPSPTCYSSSHVLHHLPASLFGSSLLGLLSVPGIGQVSSSLRALTRAGSSEPPEPPSPCLPTEVLLIFLGPQARLYLCHHLYTPWASAFTVPVAIPYWMSLRVVGVGRARIMLASSCHSPGAEDRSRLFSVKGWLVECIGTLGHSQSPPGPSLWVPGLHVGLQA